jgi:hypothetical protein
MKALETSYAGCRFRSRLEARWAVFFDYIRAEWEYEPEGFKTRAGNYLPDFRITVCESVNMSLWVEVKPSLTNIVRYDRRRIEAFRRELHDQSDTNYDSMIILAKIPRTFPIPYNGVDLWDGIYNGRDLMMLPDIIYGIVTEEKVQQALDAARSERFGT